MYSLWKYVSLINLVAIEMLSTRQQENCAITQLYTSILNSYLAHMFFAMIYITGLPGCYMGMLLPWQVENYAIILLYESISSSY